ncbi:N-acetylglucosamine-6-phosphate deacetylase [Georgenia faecalis]|uniref:N-acetylglucosamine-6-phosphate deacetylase n=1 Tax=Georgenia faecalis TaxID=2483799 RepID=A0ABV9D8W2_9MICO|nr:amidohydrolase family protein [Georgenia faecalis]
MNRIEGLDPATGDLLTVTYADGVVTGIDRSTAAPGDLPYLAPGLVDLQVNGYGGADVNADEPSADAVREITHALAAVGVTSWVPTVVTASEERIGAALRAVAQARDADAAVAAAVPFAHVEGPFLSDRDGPRGVHDAGQIRPVDAAEVERWLAHGPVGYVTLSPHTADAAGEIAAIRRLGVEVSVGHTHADPGQIRAAVDAGASLSTHLGNGIFAELPRHPNPIWTQLADDRLTCGLIADGHHLPPETLRTMIRAKGPGRAFLVSDATALAGSAPGCYTTAVGGEVELSATGRLSYRGTPFLAGAAVSLAFGLAYAVRHAGVSVAEGIALASTTPGALVARMGGAPRGVLRLGAPADLVQLSAAGDVLAVVAQGHRLQ